MIRDLADGNRRFCELERSLDGISPRTLSLRLRALEECGIVERHTYPEVPPRVEYALTEKGRALVPLIEDMRSYGAPLARCPSEPPSRTLQARLQLKEAPVPGRSLRPCAIWWSERRSRRWPATRPSGCASWSPSARRSPTRCASPATARRSAAYEPLTERFVRDHAQRAARARLVRGRRARRSRSAGLAGPVPGEHRDRRPAEDPRKRAELAGIVFLCRLWMGSYRLLARRRPPRRRDRRARGRAATSTPARSR